MFARLPNLLREPESVASVCVSEREREKEREMENREREIDRKERESEKRERGVLLARSGTTDEI